MAFYLVTCCRGSKASKSSSWFVRSGAAKKTATCSGCAGSVCCILIRLCTKSSESCSCRAYTNTLTVDRWYYNGDDCLHTGSKAAKSCTLTICAASKVKCCVEEYKSSPNRNRTSFARLIKLTHCDGKVADKAGRVPRIFGLLESEVQIRPLYSPIYHAAPSPKKQRPQ